MPGVIRIGGRIYAVTRDFRSEFTRAGDARPLATNERNDNNPSDGTPIEPDSPDSPFRVGTPYHDVHEDVWYRVVARLNIAEGWGTAGFWIARWGCFYGDVLKLVRMGWLDAALEHGSAVKRFRCRDEIRVLRWMEENAPPPSPAPVRRKKATKRRT